jgi:acetyl-CoA decarbonylase/synthase complex subunit gamma
MGLTGIDIFKKLPKKNCGECGVPTCLAFAMALAAGKTELAKCPYVSPEAAESLSEASAPPVRPVVIGAGDKAWRLGAETVEFRHEKTFVSQPAFAVLVTTDMDDAAVDAKLKALADLQYERIGLTLCANMIVARGDDAAKLEALAKKAADTGYPVVVSSSSADAVAAAGKAIADKKPLLHAATPATVDACGDLAKELGCPVAVKADSYDAIMEMTKNLQAKGLKEIIIDTGAAGIKQAFLDQVQIRRAAIKNKERALGFPTIAFVCDMTDDPMMEAMYASVMVAKYAGIVVLSDLKGESLFPLLLERLNIYTDPQRPMATTQGIYEIGQVTENSPVLITSNFSLTYFIVSGEIEASRVGAYLLVLDTDGLSVLTAWAAGKFAADSIAIFVKKSGIEEKVKHRKLIIPGFAAQISGELEEELSGWEIQIGPREAAHIAAFLKQWSAD